MTAMENRQSARVAKMFRNSAFQIDTLILVDRIDLQTIRRLPCIGDALTSAEIDELADNRAELKEMAEQMRAHADAIDPPKDD